MFQPAREHLEQIYYFHEGGICHKIWYFYLQGILYFTNMFGNKNQLIPKDQTPNFAKSNPKRFYTKAIA